jgi:hypothetical protein
MSPDVIKAHQDLHESLRDFYLSVSEPVQLDISLEQESISPLSHHAQTESEQEVGRSPQQFPWLAPSSDASVHSSVRKQSAIDNSPFLENLDYANEPLGIDLSSVGIETMDDFDELLTFPASMTQKKEHEQEITAFYRYAKGIADDSGTNYGLALINIVYLFDLLQDVASRALAARAFYNVLELAHKSKIGVVQTQNFADIQILF